jgi:hypothetical protein
MLRCQYSAVRYATLAMKAWVLISWRSSCASYAVHEIICLTCTVMRFAVRFQSLNLAQV